MGCRNHVAFAVDLFRPLRHLICYASDTTASSTVPCVQSSHTTLLCLRAQKTLTAHVPVWGSVHLCSSQVNLF